MEKVSPYLEAFISGAYSGLSYSDQLDFVLDRVEKENYQHYIPIFCRLIETESDVERRHNAYHLVNRILLPEAGNEVIDFLISRLKIETKSLELILIILSKLKIHKDADQVTLKRLAKSRDLFIKNLTFEVFAAFMEGSGETFILDVLRNTDDKFDIYSISKILGNNGSLFALPVLMARITSDNHELNSSICIAVDLILLRLGMPEELTAKLKDISFWKLKWAGTSESFVGFMMVVQAMGGMSYTEEQSDQLAEIFAEEMGVDFSPYQSYRDLRICSSSDDFFINILNFQDNIESRVFTELALNGIGIVESTQTQVEQLYMELMNDYLMTKLRRKITFSDEQF